MNLFRSVGAIAGASSDGTVDWVAAAEAAKAATSAGSIDLDPGEQEGYADDVRDARDGVRAVTGLDFDVPGTIEVQNRHHWIDANVRTFEEIMRPLESRRVFLPAVTVRVNSLTMATLLSFLANHVLGQYDPLLLAESDDHGLYFVRPNILRISAELDVDYPRFRRWIAFHEVTHAAEFAAAPWLSDYLETHLEDAVDDLSHGSFRPAGFAELDQAMTAVEGYAEFVMDRAFDDRSDDLRAKVEARRRTGGPFSLLVRRLLGLGMKRRQYERGRAFFEAVVERKGMATAMRVWEDPGMLPTGTELDEPRQWLDRL